MNLFIKFSNNAYKHACEILISTTFHTIIPTIIKKKRKLETKLWKKLEYFQFQKRARIIFE